MLVLGLDPSTTSTGYGLVDGDGRHAATCIDCGCFRPPRKVSFDQRLRVIFDGVNEVLRTHRPDAVALESSFYGKDADAAAKLGEARGVLRLAANLAGLEAVLYSPAEVKKALTGSGQATKESVQYMVAQTLKMKELPRPLDASDALAVAVCHLHRPGVGTSDGRARKPEIEALLRRVSSR
ncbi:MAG: crossover junction endodeoxyribonuclease RuvC [Gemmatimonadetes bacterium]|nr:crossover junction endodeoxyribonuclease RuvC [Gemmatimonadota bacterium]MBT7860513.1 crossover junction endodeoxyribonuclease RuvC [Gemmatimonadota bacterium]